MTIDIHNRDHVSPGVTLTREQTNLVRFLVERALLHSDPVDLGYYTRYVMTYTRDERAALEELLASLR